MECLIYFISSNDDDESNGGNGGVMKWIEEKESQYGYLHCQYHFFKFLFLSLWIVIRYGNDNKQVNTIEMNFLEKKNWSIGSCFRRIQIKYTIRYHDFRKWNFFVWKNNQMSKYCLIRRDRGERKEIRRKKAHESFLSIQLSLDGKMTQLFVDE